MTAPVKPIIIDQLWTIVANKEYSVQDSNQLLLDQADHEYVW